MNKFFTIMFFIISFTTLPALSFAQSMVLVLKSLECHETEDWNGADEPYLTVNGKKVWNGVMNDGDIETLSIRRTVSSPAYIKLYDTDSGMFDKNDHLGTVTATSSMKGRGTMTGGFTQDGANYTLYYHVE